jgi:hypothetical protein
MSVSVQANALIDFTKLACAPSKEADGRCGVTCFTTDALTAETRAMVLIPLLASAGLNLRQAGLSKFASVGYIDRMSGSQRRAYMVSAARASALQSAIHDGKLQGVENIKRAVGDAFAEITFPQR